MQLQNDLPTLEKAGYGLAAISYDSVAILKDFAGRKHISFPLLSDHDSKNIRAYGVANRQFPKGAQMDVEREIIYTNTFDNTPVYGLAYPSVFVLDPSLKIRWRYVSEAAELRLTGNGILEHAVGITAAESRTSTTSGKLQIVTTASNSTAGLGNRIVLGVEIKLPVGLHVYTPKVSAPYRGVTWQMDDSQCWDAAEVNYPLGTARNFVFADEALPIFENTVRLTRELVIRPVLKATDPSIYKLFCELCVNGAGEIRASGVLKYQACDERQCFPPTTVPLKWAFHFLPPDRERSPLEIRREFEP